MLLDTNVLSELMRPQPSPAVLGWFGQCPANTRHLVSAVTKAEITLGIELLPQGQRKTALGVAAQGLFEQDLQGRILPFDSDTATVYARIVAHRNALGRPISTEDAQIAATALQHHIPLATRNLRDFELIPDLQLINPWTP